MSHRKRCWEKLPSHQKANIYAPPRRKPELVGKWEKFLVTKVERQESNWTTQREQDRESKLILHVCWLPHQRPGRLAPEASSWKDKSANVLGPVGCTRVLLLTFIFVPFRAHSTFPEHSSCKARADTRWLYTPVLDDRVRIRVPGKSWELGVMALVLENAGERQLSLSRDVATDQPSCGWYSNTQWPSLSEHLRCSTHTISAPSNRSHQRQLLAGEIHFKPRSQRNASKPNSKNSKFMTRNPKAAAMPAIPAPWRLGQDDHEFEAGLEYIARSSSKIRKIKNSKYKKRRDILGNKVQKTVMWEMPGTRYVSLQRNPPAF